MKHPEETSQLVAILSRIVDTRRGERTINPSWVATEALIEIDPDGKSPPLVRVGCHLELRQLARGLLREVFERGESADDAHPLFPELQWRYPQASRKGDAEPSYILLDEMMPKDIAYNVDRLRMEGRSKLAHADRLEAFGMGRRAA
jgi:hypothetical protein